MKTPTDRRKLREKTMTDTNRDTLNVHSHKMLIIAVTVVVLFIIFMYFRDRQQQHAFELRRLEKRVELLEEWGVPRQNVQ
jgi:cell division protein FtsN